MVLFLFSCKDPLLGSGNIFKFYLNLSFPSAFRDVLTIGGAHKANGKFEYSWFEYNIYTSIFLTKSWLDFDNYGETGSLL